MKFTRTLSKYWQIFQINWQAALQYRAELIMWAFIEAMPLLAMFILWFAIYRHGDQLAGYSYINIVMYYLVGFVINRATNTNAEVSYVDQVVNGDITKHILKPFSVKQLFVLDEASWRTMNIIFICMPILILLTATSPEVFNQINFLQVPLFMLMLVCTFIINAFISLFILGLSFFFDQGRTLSHFKWMLEGIFSGSLLPLSAYPDWLQGIARWLPFQFKFSVPVEYVIGKRSLTDAVQSYSLAVVWVILLYALMQLSWRQGLKRFTAVGS